jgi:hypothetical protein
MILSAHTGSSDPAVDLFPPRSYHITQGILLLGNLELAHGRQDALLRAWNPEVMLETHSRHMDRL